MRHPAARGGEDRYAQHEGPPMSGRLPAAVLFDLDGTLVDSAPDLAGAGNEMRVARGLPALPLDHFRPMVGSAGESSDDDQDAMVFLYFYLFPLFFFFFLSIGQRGCG